MLDEIWVLLLCSRLHHQVSDDRGVEELHRELRREVLVAEVRRVVVGHELDGCGVAVPQVMPEPGVAES